MSAIGSSYSKCPIEVREAIADQLCPKANASKEELQKCAQDLAALSAADKLISPYCLKKLKQIKSKCQVIATFPKRPTLTNLRECVTDLTELSQNEDLEFYCLRKIEEINQAIELVGKYFNGYLDYAGNACYSNALAIEGGPPQLIQIFGTLLPYMWNSRYSDYVRTHHYADLEDDIVKIIDVLPQSLHSRMGVIGLYTGGYDAGRCTPLTLASYCYLYNKIPLYIVEYLLTKGANPNDTISSNDQFESIMQHINEHRYHRDHVPAKNVQKLNALLTKYGARSFSRKDDIYRIKIDTTRPAKHWRSLVWALKY